MGLLGRSHILGSMNRSVEEPVPDGRGLADEGLIRWVSEVRRSVGPSCREAGAERLRASAQARWASRPCGPELALVQDLRTDQGLAVRVYRPSLNLRPAVLYLHGGGFVMGDLESHDGTCRRLARIADVTVLAVDYRLAPEHRGPAAVEDTVGAFVWARQHLQELGGDPEAGVALAGDSSGGALAVLAAVRLHVGGMTPSALLLAYPNADMTLRTDSVTQEGHGWGLETDDLRWFVEQWLPAPDRCDDPQVSPAHADLTGLPPTLLATAEHDPLRDEGNALVQQLRDVGVEVQHVPHAGLVHGFLGLSHVSEAAADAGRDLFDRFGDLLRNRAAVSSH
jgi:acetyl esterase/lipase